MEAVTISETRDMHVLIIGAGVTGLLIAQGLKKAGIKFSIFEAEPSATYYRPREWSMAIHWSLPQLEALLPSELKGRLKEAMNDPHMEPPEKDSIFMYNGLDGSVLKTLPIPRTIRVSRRKMRVFCKEGVDVKYGYELTDIAYGKGETEVTATFLNGESVTGSIIVGCDGPRSKVREKLLGLEKGSAVPMGIVQSNLAIIYHDAEKARFVRSAHPSFSCMLHPQVMGFLATLDIPDENDPANWVFQLVTCWLEPYRSAWKWIPDDTKMTYNNIAYWVTVPWDNQAGRVTLAGDAAHPMPPHRGQGLNHAICDANNFVAAVQKVVEGTTTLQDAISAYSDEVVKRGATEVLSSCENTLDILNWDRLMRSRIMTHSLERSA